MKNKPISGKPPNLDAKIIKALTNPQFKYRTAQGIARETHIDKNQVDRVLRISPTVRISITKAVDGSNLYALKNKVSTASDFWTAFKAVNGAKFGD